MSLLFPLTASASILGIQQGGTAVSSTSAKVAYYVDGSRGDTYLADGSILSPFKTVSAMLSGIWKGATGYVFNLNPATYVDGAPDTFPNIPFYLAGNESTLVEPSGVTFPNSFDIYDLTIVGNVHESDNTITTIHQFTNGVISGNLQMDGNATIEGEAVTGGQYFLISTSSLTNIAGSFIQNPIWANGVVNINDDQVSTSTPQALVISTTTSFTSQGQFGNTNILGATFINTGGPGLNLNNGATSTPNNVFDASMVINSTHSLIVGNSATTVCGFQSYNLAGTFVPPEASSTAAWLPCIDEKLNVLNGLQLTNLGTPAGSFLAVDPSGNVIATSTPAVGGGGTVTSVATNNTLTGGTITTSGTLGLNLSNSNWWTARQNFTQASTSMLTATSSVWLTSLATPAGTFLAVDPNGLIIATTTTGVTSVTGTWPIISSGGNTPVISWGGLSTTTNLTAGQLVYATGVGSITSVATTSGTCGSGVSCTAVPYVGSTNPSFSLDQTFGAVWTAASTTFTQHLSLNTASTSLFTSNSTAWLLGATNFGSTQQSSISASGVLTLGTALGVSSGGTGQATFTAGQLLYGNSTNALSSVATSSETCSSPLSCGSFAIVGTGGAITLGNVKNYPSFTYSTSTTWIGTTTIQLGPAFVAETWNSFICYTDAGTLNIQFSWNGNAMTLANASTTMGTTTISTNGAITAGSKRSVAIGTPASSPTYISCTVNKTLSIN